MADLELEQAERGFTHEAAGGVLSEKAGKLREENCTTT